MKNLNTWQKWLSLGLALIVGTVVSLFLIVEFVVKPSLGEVRPVKLAPSSTPWIERFQK